MDFTLESDRSGVVAEHAFQLIVLGDWAGAGERKELPLRAIREIDRDNFDDVMDSLGVRSRLVIEGAEIELSFKSLDDFHPDSIYQNVPVFSGLRDLRKRLKDPATFNEAAREVRGATAEKVEENTVPAGPSASSDGLLDAILAKPEGGSSVPKAALSSDLADLVSDLVRPHLVSVNENEQAAMLRSVDEATSAVMRSILHDRAFQHLEASWRGLFFLVRRADTDSDLRICILDVPKAEFVDDLKGEGFVFKTANGGHKGDPFASIVADYAFSPDVDDIAALIRAAKASAAIGTPFISHIRPEVVGVNTLDGHTDQSEWDLSEASDGGKLWSALRGVPEARYLGLAIPRFIARLPYGSDTEPAERFAFEEFGEVFSHDDYVWSNPCFAVASLLAATFTEFGWEFGERFVQDIDGLPLHMYKKDGASFYQPCAEVQLSQNAAEALGEYGLMPLVSFKNLDRVSLVRFRAVSSTDTELHGRWK